MTVDTSTDELLRVKLCAYPNCDQETAGTRTGPTAKYCRVHASERARESHRVARIDENGRPRATMLGDVTKRMLNVEREYLAARKKMERLVAELRAARQVYHEKEVEMQRVLEDGLKELRK